MGDYRKFHSLAYSCVSRECLEAAHYLGELLPEDSRVDHDKDFQEWKLSFNIFWNALNMRKE